MVSGASIAKEEPGGGGGGGVFGMFASKKPVKPATLESQARSTSVDQGLFREFSFMASDALGDD